MNTSKKGRLFARIPGRYFPWTTFAFVCLLSCLLAILFRSIQLGGSINFATGFYNGSSALMFALNFSLVLFAVLLFLMSWMSRTEYLIQMGRHSHKALKYLSFVLCAAFLINGFVDLYQMMISRTQVMGVLEIFGAAASIGAGLSFLFQGLTIQQPRESAVSALYGVPCIWSCIVLITMFVQHTVVVTVSENLYNILRMIFLVIFLLTSSKFLAGYADKKNERWLLFTGLMTIVLSAVTTIPLLIVRLFGKFYTVSHVVQAGPLDFLLMLYTAVFVFAYLKGRRRTQL
ncbi:MAG: hypothetical protein SOY88_04245 [Massilioclostridium sp.]|nr:hypothetical protein [Massilioclostridium sp.]